jgi:hypothetical protein
LLQKYLIELKKPCTRDCIALLLNRQQGFQPLSGFGKQKAITEVTAMLAKEPIPKLFAKAIATFY